MDSYGWVLINNQWQILQTEPEYMKEHDEHEGHRRNSANGPDDECFIAAGVDAVDDGDGGDGVGKGALSGRKTWKPAHAMEPITKEELVSVRRAMSLFHHHHHHRQSFVSFSRAIGNSSKRDDGSSRKRKRRDSTMELCWRYGPWRKSALSLGTTQSLSLQPLTLL